MRATAWNAVRKAVRDGELPPVDTHVCVDCGEPARAYDHRDYRKPLEVEPVCYLCNSARGPAVLLGVDRYEHRMSYGYVVSKGGVAGALFLAIDFRDAEDFPSL